MVHSYFHTATKATMAKAPISRLSQHTTSSAIGSLSFYDLIAAVAVTSHPFLGAARTNGLDNYTK
jgi:hypothetical protein